MLPLTVGPDERSRCCLVISKIISPQSSGEEDRWRGLWGGLRSFGSVEPVHGCLKGRVRSTSQTGAQDGGGCVEETSG